VCRVVLIVGLALASISLHGCASNQANPPASTNKAPAAADLQVRRGEFRNTFLLTGELEAVTGYPVIIPRTPVWQVTIRWVLEDGSMVEEGDKVVELDTTQVVGDVVQKRIAADTALSQLYQKEAEVAVGMADKEFAVVAARIAFEKAALKAAVPEELINRREYQEAQLAAERTRVAHENAVADLEAFRDASESETEILQIQVDKARREVSRAERALDTMVLRAPRAGILVVGQNPREGRKFKIGDAIWPGFEIAEIPDLSRMRVRARLSDVDDGKIHPGMRAECTVDAYPGRPIGGVVSDIGPVAREEPGRSARRHFKVLIDLERSDPSIMRPGMSVRVEVESRRREDVLLVPRAAVDIDAGGARVISTDGRETEVTLGECNASVCELIDGPAEGARLRRVGG
jgi:multidrug resistance efflux pump